VIAFDANIHFYAVDWRDPSKQAASADLLDKTEIAGAGIVLLQALGEFAYSAVRKGVVSRREARTAVKDWARLFPVAAADATILDMALDWWAEERLSYWDALLVATAAKAGARAIVSEDLQDGAMFGGVEIINPFKEGATMRLAAHGLD
jgi:predicted nucleic acid-binding protein